ncbi:hypothetical protein MPNT_140041 [Candidatus Methylacidithermus pantelleriae]|uniref:Uncharacterized protein n=1 Tax=Candidatus Methylacidithermus pantelleriae TaxID=2744239 RepID=A0A8J2BMR4_9BACT|nr:hypothetical protein MPNT_140041 [Candidatus Methylacidithermus pantelleriae]
MDGRLKSFRVFPLNSRGAGLNRMSLSSSLESIESITQIKGSLIPELTADLYQNPGPPPIPLSPGRRDKDGTQILQGMGAFDACGCCSHKSSGHSCTQLLSAGCETAWAGRRFTP